MIDPKDHAPGAPGLETHRANHLLSGLGKSFQATSRVTFSLSRGTVSEILFPVEAHSVAHDMQWIVTDGKDFFSEEKRHADHDTAPSEEGVPAYRIINTCRQGKYRITKEVVTDPFRDTLLQKTLFTPLEPSPSGNPYRLFLLLTPHIGESSDSHNAWTADYKGIPMLFAQKNGVTMALACSHPWKRRSVGYTGVSDGWMDLAAHRQMTREYRKAESGRVVLTCEVVLPQRTRPETAAAAGPAGAARPNGANGAAAATRPDGAAGANSTELVVALGFGQDEHEAAGKAWSSLLEGFEGAKDQYVTQWRSWQHALSSMATGNTLGKYVRTSVMVLRLLEAKTFPGALQASLYGAGVVRPRDLGAAFGAYMALGAPEDAQRLLGFLMATQEPGGYWPQTMHVSGIPISRAAPLDQVAQVILMVDACRRSFLLSPGKMQRYWEIVLKAVSYLVGSGPVTPLDRWGSHQGIAPYTLAIEIAALLAAADMAEEKQEPGIATYCRKTADYLQQNIDNWTYISGAYRSVAYIGATDEDGISTDALALVRFGLRKADDPRILSTVAAIDAQLKVETRYGPCWKRFSRDIGAWPLLTAERGLYEIAAGNLGGAASLLGTVEALSHHGYFPEQVWDIPAGHSGEPSGTPLPVSWTHAEYLLLCCSLKENRILDMPRFTRERYLEKAPAAPFVVWRFNMPCADLPRDKKLRIELKGPALIHWTDDNWVTKQHILTRDTHLGIFVAELTPKNNDGTELIFTFFWLNTDRWEDKNYSVALAQAAI